MTTITTPQGTSHAVEKEFAVVYQKGRVCAEFNTQGDAEQFASTLGEVSYIYRIHGLDVVVVQIRMSSAAAVLDGQRF